MSYTTVLNLIQQFIVANGNNEITANVLRPVLEDILEFANLQIGDLTTLSTSDKSNLVNAINEILSLNLPNRTALRPIDLAGVDFNQNELSWVAEAVNNTISNNGNFTCELGEQMVFTLDKLISFESGIYTFKTYYYRLLTGQTVVSSLSVTAPPLMPDGSSETALLITSDIVIDLGNIGTDDIEDAFNSDTDQPFAIIGDTFVQAIQDGNNKFYKWIGGDGSFGNSATLAVATYFVDLTEDIPPIADVTLQTPTWNRLSFYAPYQTTEHTDAELQSVINTQGFEILNNTLSIIHLYSTEKIDGVTSYGVTNMKFKGNDTPGTYGSGSTNGTISFPTDFIVEYYTPLTVFSSGTDEGYDLGEIGTTTIYAYINALDTTGLDWETLDAGVTYTFSTLAEGVLKIYQYTGVQPRDVGSAYSVANPLLVTDFDLQDTETPINTVEIPYQISLSDLESDLEIKTLAESFDTYFNGTLTYVGIECIDAPTGAKITVGIKNNGVTMLSTDVTIDIGEKTSRTASVPVVISVPSVSVGDNITLEIKTVGTTTKGKGLKATLIFTKL